MFEKRVFLHVLIEKSDHGDGYCSGDECDYFTDSVKLVVPIPDDVDIMETDEISTSIRTWQKYLNAYRNGLHCNDSGYGYCTLSEECESRGLGKHDIRLTVTKCEVIEIFT